MKLFLKHVTRAMLRRPWRPLLLALTVTLAVALAMTATGLSVMLYDNALHNIRLKQEMGDIRITPRGDSGTRFLWSEDVENAVGEDGEVLGEFRLSGLALYEGEERLLTISALDLYEADRFFEFQYLAMGEFTTQNLSRAAIISESTAKTYGLRVGDILTVHLLQQDIAYTVQAIAKDTGALREAGMLISLSGVLMMLSEQLPVIGTFGDSDYPYTRLLVKADDPAKIPEILTRITSSDLFADKLVQHVDGAAELDFWLVMQLTVIFVVTLLLLMLCGVLMTGTLHMIHRQRAQEYALFRSIGATRRQIHAAVYMESGIIAFVGTVGGILLSLPMLLGVIGIYGWETSLARLALAALPMGICFPPLLTYLCTALHLRRADHLEVGRGEAATPLPRRAECTRKTVLLPLGLTLLFALLGILLPVKLRIFSMVALLFSQTWLIFLVTSLCLKGMARYLEKLLEHRDTRQGGWLLAIKGLHNHTAIRHIGRMLTVLCMLIATVVCCRHSLVQYFDILTGDAPFMMLTSSMSEELQESFEQDEAVTGVLQVTYVSGVALPNGGRATAISLSGDMGLWFDPALVPRHYPVGQELAISRGLATLAGVREGDTLTLVLDGVSHTFTVTEVMPIQPNFIYFDATALGIKHDLTCVGTADESAATVQRLQNMAEMGGSAILPLSALLGTGPETATSHLTLLRYALIIAALLSLVGCLNIVLEHLHERRGEGSILRLCGMTRGRLYLLYARELLLTLPVVLTVAATGTALLCLAVHFGVGSFGMVLFV
ncbi:MAG: hypothetical protein IJW51_01450 [Clostridia bacterium]|nr:hypothetical protein [Clostridia bacterium]